jgi:hypothetical protein
MRINDLLGKQMKMRRRRTIMERSRYIRGSFMDFSTFFTGIFSIKHSHFPPSYFRIRIVSSLKVKLSIYSAISIAKFPFMSLRNLGASLYNRAFTERVDWILSTLLTAKCSAEYPSLSLKCNDSRLLQAKM